MPWVKKYVAIKPLLTVFLLLFCVGEGDLEISKHLETIDKKSTSFFYAVSGGLNHGLAINKTGELWSWGRGRFGRLGHGSVSADKYRPTKINHPDSAKNWKEISGGGAHTLAITETGELYAWGNNHYGQLGDGITGDKNTPTRIGNAINWKKISAGNVHNLAITETGELYAWGGNDYGELGDGTTANKDRPAKIGNAKKWKKISAGNLHSLAITETGELYAWGGNGYGQLGNGTTANKDRPIKINYPDSAKNWKEISGGGCPYPGDYRNW